jgi:hypothetical protein
VDIIPMLVMERTFLYGLLVKKRFSEYMNCFFTLDGMRSNFMLRLLGQFCINSQCSLPVFSGKIFDSFNIE